MSEPQPPAWNPSRCPLCGQTNQCAQEIARDTHTTPAPCWCAQVDFSADLLARVPASARNRACICQRCVSTWATPSTQTPPLP